MNARKKRAASVPEEAQQENKNKIEKIKSLAESLPPEERLKAISIVETTIQQSYSGPLPTPEDFEKYDQIHPGTAERILSMAEKEQHIRAAQVGSFFNNQRLNISLAGATSLGIIVIAGIGAWQGNAAIALPLGLVGLATIFLRILHHWMSRR